MVLEPMWRIVASHVGSPIVDVVEGPRAFRSKLWRVFSTDGQYLLKVPVRNSDWKNHTAASALAHRSGIPTPPLLASGTAADGSEFVLQRWVDGEDAQRRIPNMTAVQRQQLFNDLGAALRRLHQVRSTRFAPKLTNDSSLHRMNWAHSVEQAVDSLPTRFRSVDAPFGSLEKEASVTSTKDAAQFGHYVIPTFVHGDLHWGNVVVNDGGSIAAILDWERAHFADPMVDFVGPHMNMFERQTDEQALIHGYTDGGSQPLPPGASERIQLAARLVYLKLLPYYWRTDRMQYEVVRARLERTVTADTGAMPTLTGR